MGGGEYFYDPIAPHFYTRPLSWLELKPYSYVTEDGSIKENGEYTNEVPVFKETQKNDRQKFAPMQTRDEESCHVETSGGSESHVDTVEDSVDKIVLQEVNDSKEILTEVVNGEVSDRKNYDEKLIVPAEIQDFKTEEGNPADRNGKILDEESAARKIQATFRGHTVRSFQPLKYLKIVSKVKREFEEMKKAFLNNSGDLPSLKNPKDKLKATESLMALLLELDTVQVILTLPFIFFSKVEFLLMPFFSSSEWM